MAVTQSRAAALGTEAPPFELPTANPSVDDLTGELRSLDGYAGAEALVVAFLCNHCPYVQHIEEALIQAARDYAPRGVQFVGICSNNAETHPEDSFEKMTERALEKDYSFPYLRDETQAVARAYGAACTPDFFVYDAERRLAYRGRFDESRPGGGEPTGRDLRRALDELLETGRVSTEQLPSIGCGIKWKPGHAPA